MEIAEKQPRNKLLSDEGSASVLTGLMTDTVKIALPLMVSLTLASAFIYLVFNTGINITYFDDKATFTFNIFKAITGLAMLGMVFNILYSLIKIGHYIFKRNLYKTTEEADKNSYGTYLLNTQLMSCCFSFSDGLFEIKDKTSIFILQKKKVYR